MRRDEWSQALVGGVAKAVRFHRKRRHMSAQQLADECELFGYPMPRSVLTNLENGRREAVSVAELLVLSAALRVPPVLLLFPLGRVAVTEALPDMRTSTWGAVQWVLGERERPDVETDILHGGQTIGVFRFHESQVAHALANLKAAHRSEKQVKPLNYPVDTHRLSAQEYLQIFHMAESVIYQLRGQMRKAGLIPPELPPGLAHIDTPDFYPTIKMSPVCASS